MKSADARTLSTAKKLLYSELAVASGRDLDDISEELDGYLGEK